MSSPIEEIIEDIEEYIDNCKTSAFSSSKITVNRDELESLVSELKTKIPDEVNKYQKVINNQQAILDAARKEAQEIVASAEIKTNELVSEHQIMQQAYAQANEVVMIATRNAQNTIDSATRDANDIRSSAIAYTDELLRSVQEVLERSIELTRTNQTGYLNAMEGYLKTIKENRNQLAPSPIAEEIMKATPNEVLQEANKEEELPEIKLLEDDEPKLNKPTENEDAGPQISEQFFNKD